jgi:hypothetical protein
MPRPTPRLAPVTSATFAIGASLRSRSLVMLSGPRLLSVPGPHDKTALAPCARSPRTWHRKEGWGSIQIEDVAAQCFVHFSCIVQRVKCSLGTWDQDASASRAPGESSKIRSHRQLILPQMRVQRPNERCTDRNHRGGFIASFGVGTQN